MTEALLAIASPPAARISATTRSAAADAAGASGAVGVAGHPGRVSVLNGDVEMLEDLGGLVQVEIGDLNQACAGSAGELDEAIDIDERVVGGADQRGPQQHHAGLWIHALLNHRRKYRGEAERHR